MRGKKWEGDRLKERRSWRPRKRLRLDKTRVILSGSTRTKWPTERGAQSQQPANETRDYTLQLSLSKTQVLAQLARPMMNGTAPKQERTVMLTNKGRWRAGGEDAMRDGARAALATGSRWKEHTDGRRWKMTRVTRDRGYVQQDVGGYRVLLNRAHWSIHQSERTSTDHRTCASFTLSNAFVW